MMKQADFEAWIMELPNVQREENFGYVLFFVGDDRRLPFVTIADIDTEYDQVSGLNREGVFRLNIGVSEETFRKLIAGKPAETIDYSALNEFLPHPHYARQHFVCILNPAGDHVETTKQLITEAHSLAERRLQRKGGG
jgi:predicted DNA-binding protein (MmcQ/YjbR family)